MTRVLVVEDEESYSEALSYMLRKEGFEVAIAENGDDALKEFDRNGADIVLLDLMLPGIPGTEVCRQIRNTSTVPVIMVSAKDDEVDKVVGLELGADDYVTKPFELPELVARIRAVLRRSSVTPAEQTIDVHDLVIDPTAFTVTKGGEEVKLTATEFRLLLELAQHPKQVFTRELLLELVWNYEYLGDSRLVDVAVQRLRSKIEDDAKEPRHIKTVRGVGYRVDAE